MNDLYSPHTGEHIQTDTPADWMAHAGIDAPSYAVGESALWQSGAWVVVQTPAPEVVVPQQVTMRQARLALLQAGLLTAVNSALAALPGTAGDASRIEWEYAQDVRRDWPIVQSLAAALALTDAQLDDLFTAAVEL